MNRHLKKTVRALVCFLLLFGLTGCWDSRELDTLSIVTGVGIDASRKADQLELTFQVGKTEKEPGKEASGGTGSAFLLMEASDPNLLSGMETLKFQNSRALFLHHNQVIVFGKDLAEKGIKSYLDIFMRSHETRMEVWLLVADGDARSILKTETQQDKISAVSITRMILNQRKVSQQTGVNLLNFTSKLMDKTISPTALMIRNIEQDGEKKLALCGLAVFKDDVMVGQLDNYLTEGFIFGAGDVTGGIVNVTAEKGTASLNVVKSQCKLTPILSGDGSITADMKIKTQLDIGEIHGFQDMNLMQVEPVLKDYATRDIEMKVQSCFAETQRLNADIYGIGAAVHRSDQKEWKSMEDIWHQIYPKIKLSLDVQVEIRGTGKISDSLTMKEGQS
ncbi:MAG TPA: Ger(x)C family spore germination protein [Ruminococcaceae bacterium]|jgi:spore germination protein KC|nr:Ger(x)C family spore germination protein [Oscillospiraceae bacterium]